MNETDRSEAVAIIVVHRCPPPGEGMMPCCGRPPFETPGDRITLIDELVTCGRVALGAVPTEETPPDPDDGIGLLPLDALRSIATHSSDLGSRWVAGRALQRALQGSDRDSRPRISHQIVTEPVDTVADSGQSGPERAES